MNRYIIYFVVEFFALQLSAQSKHFFDVEVLSGYEYNYFRSPKEVQREGSLFTKDQLLASSIYQDILVDYDYRYKWNKNRIRISVNPEARLFYENFEDSYWSIRILNRYDYEINDKTKFLLETSIKRMDRQGLDGDIDVLISPLGYFTYGGSTGAEFAPFPNNLTTIEGFYNFKNYDNYGTRDLQYDEYGIQLGSEQNFKNGALKHSYGINTYLKKRLYDTYNSSDSSPAGVRKWNYLHGNFYYELPINQQLDIKPSFSYTARVDKEANRSGYNEYGPALQLMYKNDKISVRPKIEYLRRNYTDIEAKSYDGSVVDLIQYGYTNFSLTANHKLSENWMLTADVFSKIRSSNNNDISARSFRSYRNQFMGLGIKYEM